MLKPTTISQIPAPSQFSFQSPISRPVPAGYGGCASPATAPVASTARIMIPDLGVHHQPAPLWSRLTHKIKNNASALTAFGAITTATGVVAAQEYLDQISQGTETQWAVSSACTKAIKTVLMPAVILPTAHVLMSKLSSSLGTLRGNCRPIDVHKIGAALLTTAAGVHTFCSLYWDPKSVTTQSGITGLTMWGSVVGPLAGSYLIEKLPCKKYIPYPTRFLRPHQVGFLLFSAAYAAHTKNLSLVPSVALPIAVVGLDKMIESGSLSQTSRIRHAQVEGDRVLLTIERPLDFQYHAGDYVYLKLPPKKFSHPLTIAGSSSEYLFFSIAPSGPSTRALFDAVNSGALEADTEITLTGPFHAQVECTHKGTTTVTVSTGSGVTPYTALLGKLAEQAPVAPPLIMVHSERHWQSFTHIVQSVHDAMLQGVHVRKVHLFITSRTHETNAHSPDLRILDPREQLHEMIRGLGMNSRNAGEMSMAEPPLDRSVEFILYEGRFLAGKLSEHLPTTDPFHELQNDLLEDRRIVVNFCGNKELAGAISQFCSTYGLRLHQDSFHI